MKKLLILTASKDICGDEVGLITHQAGLLGIEIKEEKINDADSLVSAFRKYNEAEEEFDYLYLCTHGNKDGFEIDLEKGSSFMEWCDFSGYLCENGIMAEDGIILLACCKGGLFKVTSEIWQPVIQ